MAAAVQTATTSASAVIQGINAVRDEARSAYSSLDLTRATRDDIKRAFNTSFDLYEKLFEIMATDDTFYIRPEPLRHPLIFYYGHTAVFYINKLVLTKNIYSRVNPRLESLLAVGVDEMSWDDLNAAHYDWPRVSEVREYRNQVRAVVNDFIDSLAPPNGTIDWSSPYWIVAMGIDHEKIHLETSSVLMRQLPISEVKCCDAFVPCRKSHGPPPKNELLPIPGGGVRLGKPTTGGQQYYGWDNEYGELVEDVAEFKAGKFLVSNGEYKEFIDDDGYNTRRYWTEEGWNWKVYMKAEHPLWWVKQGNKWLLRVIMEEIPMLWDHPVDVNYLEAKAFCNWKAEKTGQNYRLPTETEWYRLADEHYYSQKVRAKANINLSQYASSSPVSENKHGDLYDVIGNVWQHTETPTYPFPGFDVHPAYDDFTVPTFDNKHNLIKGGSFISCGNEALRDARYAFRRHFFQHAGFRYVVSDAPVTISDDHLYETDEAISQMLDATYGPEYLGIPNFSVRLTDEIMRVVTSLNISTDRIAEVGCGTGRTSFELAQFFKEVTGLDLSARYIQNAVKLLDNGRLRYQIQDEGDIYQYKEIKLTKPSNAIEFMQVDPCNMLEHYSNYDVIVACNLIDRLYEPQKFISMVHQRLRNNGLLVVVSAHDWKAETTPMQNWLGAQKIDGENLTTWDCIAEHLGKTFQLVEEPKEIEYVKKIHRRKFEFYFNQISFWQLK
eukprot:Clim_evm34s199 gene=Clim_evmTU34s199